MSIQHVINSESLFFFHFFHSFSFAVCIRRYSTPLRFVDRDMQFITAPHPLLCWQAWLNCCNCCMAGLFIIGNQETQTHPTAYAQSNYIMLALSLLSRLPCRVPLHFPCRLQYRSLSCDSRQCCVSGRTFSSSLTCTFLANRVCWLLCSTCFGGCVRICLCRFTRQLILSLTRMLP